MSDEGGIISFENYCAAELPCACDEPDINVRWIGPNKEREIAPGLVALPAKPPRVTCGRCHGWVVLEPGEST